MKITDIENPLILICEDQIFCQMGIELCLQEEFHLRFRLQKASTGREALIAAQNERPDLVVVDLCLPDMSGLDVIRNLRTLYPSLLIMVVTSSDSRILLRQASDLRVNAIMQKLSPPEEFCSLLRQMGSSRDVLLMDPPTKRILSSEGGLSLTSREWEVLREIVQGRSNREIADSLSCAITTVRFHRANIFEKTNMHNAAELTAWYLKR